jgi:predicted phosphoribosyltransferase
MFEDREDAGLRLCPKLKEFFNKNGCVVIGLTRGGIITAEKISSSLNLPLEAIVVKKIGAPENSELAIGAIISLKDIYWDLKIVKNLGISEKEKDILAAKKLDEVKKLNKILGIKTKRNEFKNKDIILVDDGVATGATVIAAAKYLKRLNAKKIILAAPVIAADTLISIKKYFDKVIYLEKRNDFYAVGQFYINFEEISDEKIANILNI